MKKLLWVIAGFIVIVYFMSDNDNDASSSSKISMRDESRTSATLTPGTYCIKKETWGAFSKDDFERMVEYSVNKELKLLEAMIVNHRVINIKKGTKVILVDYGLRKTVIRVPNSEIEIWIISDAIGNC